MPISQNGDQWNAAVFEKAPVPMALVTPDDRFFRSNDSFVALLGYSHSELSDRTWQSITHPDDVAGDESGARALRAADNSNNIYTVTKRYLPKHGEPIWVNLHVRAIWADQVFKGYVVYAIPISSATASVLAPTPRQYSLIGWAKENPKDAAIVGLSAALFLGRDQFVRLIELFKP